MRSSRLRCLGIVVPVLLAALVASPVRGASEATVSENRSILDFADALYREGDYYRAVTEFKRFLFIVPEDREGCEHARYFICRSYFEASRWTDAVESCDGFIHNHPGSGYRGEIYLLKGLSEKNLHRYDDALRSLSYCADISENLRDRAILEQALILVDREEWRRAGELSALIPRESPLHMSAVILSEGMETVETLPRKSPVRAGLCAALLPGSGHLYTDRPRDALVAFLLNASFIWAAVELFQGEHYAAGGLVTFFEAGWYAGNIYSAVSSAHKYNRDRKNQFIRMMKDKVEFPDEK